jgi:CHAD domain-containing protein
MSGTSALTALLERRLSALREHLPAALAGDVTGVHQARVASRRLRETLPVLDVLDAGSAVARARRRVRRVTRLFGPVRELDVALAHLSAHLDTHPADRQAGAMLRVWLEQTRAERRDAMLAAFDERGVARFWRQVDVLPQVLQRASGDDHVWRQVLGRRIGSRGEALAGVAAKAGVMYAAGALHAVRIATKKLRYAIELSSDLRLAPGAVALRTLKRQQDLLGEIHDLEVLAGFADRAFAASPGRIQVGGLVGDWYRQCRVLHAAYLRRRAGMLRVVELATGEIPLRVTKRPGRPTKRGLMARRGDAARATGPAAQEDR